MRRLNKKLLLVLWLFICLGTLEAAARLILINKNGLRSFWRPDYLWYTYYPELEAAASVNPADWDRTFNVLLLGGSTLAGYSGRWSNIPELLEKGLLERGFNVRVVNLAAEAHSSRDALIKYSRLAKHFDWIIYYEAINEVRANNCPDSVFDSKYNHYAWYRDINLLNRHSEIRWLALPFLLDQVFTVSLPATLGKAKPMIGLLMPNPQWTRFGANIKSAESFRENIADILALAQKRHEPISLNTYAFYVPEDYSDNGFKGRQLDYQFIDASVGIWTWGRPGNVVKGITAHNEVLRDLARKSCRPSLCSFDDMAGVIPKEGRYFKDICHLTLKGSAIFVDELLRNAPRHIRPSKFRR